MESLDPLNYIRDFSDAVEPQKLDGSQRQELLLLEEAAEELDVLGRFQETVDQEISDKENLDYENAFTTDAGIANLDREKQVELLEELRYKAYGKVVAVQRQSGKIEKYRIAQANRGVIKDSNGDAIYVINRLAPVARLLVSAEVGDVVFLPPNNEKVEVIEVELADRYTVGQLDNFASLQLVHQDLNPEFPYTLVDLRRALADRLYALFEADGNIQAKTVEATPVLAETLSLSSNFYTRTTKAQEEILRRPNRGLLIVEGVAGSGKTSVALGRIKTAYDDHEDTYFSDQTRMVGYVKSEQLVDYLKATSKELALSRMAIVEFGELQKNLLRKRAVPLELKMPGNAKGQFARAASAGEDFQTTMSWLRYVDKGILNKCSQQIGSNLERETDWIEKIEDRSLSNGLRSNDYKNLIRSVWGAASKKALLDLNVAKRRDGYKLAGVVSMLKGTYGTFWNYFREEQNWYFYDGKWSTQPPSTDQLPKQPFMGRQLRQTDADWLGRLRDTVRARFRQALCLDGTTRFPKLSSWYVDTLYDDESTGRFGVGIQNIRNRLERQELTSADLNTLLAIAQLMSRGHVYDSRDQRRLAEYLSVESEPNTAVFIDEVQDFSEIELFLMAQQADPARRCVTVVGDFKQQLYPCSVHNLEHCFFDANELELQPVFLDENKRQTKNLANFAAHFRRQIGDQSLPECPQAVHSPKELTEDTVTLDEVAALVSNFVEDAHDRSIAIICPNSELAESVFNQAHGMLERLFVEPLLTRDHRDLIQNRFVHFTEVIPTKGLEFDVVIAPYFNIFNLDDQIEANKAYVTITRPRKRLHIINVQ